MNKNMADKRHWIMGKTPELARPNFRMENRKCVMLGTGL